MKVGGSIFRPAEISILEMRIPPTVVVINTPHSEYHHNFAKEIRHIAHITEGVSYRIQQRLLSYNMEPVTSHVKDYIASSKGERDAFRSRIKLLKDKVVHGGFLGSGREVMGEEEQEIEFAALQDGIAEIKRALTEFVSCWNMKLESLDNKIKVYHSRRDVAVSRNSDRDSPFTPMASEIPPPPTRATAAPHALLPPEQEDSLLLNTPLSTPPDSSGEDGRTPGPSLNRVGDVAVVVPREALTPDSHTEIGEEVRTSSDPRSSPGSCRYTYNADRSTEKTTSSQLERATSSSDEVSQFDSRISSHSLSEETGGGGAEEKTSRMQTVSEHEVLMTGTTVASAKGTKLKPKDAKPEQEETKSDDVPSDALSIVVSSETGEPGESGEGVEMEKERSPNFRRRLLAFSKRNKTPSGDSHANTHSDSAQRLIVSRPHLSGSSELTKPVTNLDQLPDSVPDTQACLLDDDERSTNTTPNAIASEDDLEEEEDEGEGEGEGGRWWNDSPASYVSGSGSNMPWKGGAASDSEEKMDYETVKTLVVDHHVTSSKPQHLQSEETQSDGVGIFAKFRGGKDTEVREDPTRFYLVDTAELSKSSPITSSKSSDHYHGHGARPHRRPGTTPRKNGSTTAPSPTDADGRVSRGQKEKDRSFLTRPFQKLPPPFELNEHHNMHTSLKIPVAIYEKEPTSLIAYALSSREYAQEYWAMVERRSTTTQHEKLISRPPSPKMPKKQTDPPLSQLPPPTKTSALKQAYQELRKKGALNAMNVFSGLSSSDRPDAYDKSGDDSRRIEAALSSKSSQMSSSSTPSKSSQTSSSSFPATDQSAIQEDGEGIRWNTTGEHASTGSASKAGHIYLEFTAPDSSSSIFCKVYFAEEFQHLREMVFPSGEDKFIRSLSRCVKFDAKGGKSRSTFCKVIDDRFIMKQIKTVEISSFEQIAPLYFEHITTALEKKRPLILAKILGVYSIGYRNTRTGNSKRLDVIVMENLLYGRKSSKVFDLKGSMRSRYIDPSKDSSNDVLLDENFLNHICYSPVYVYPHSKAVLIRAIQEDTQFLAQNAIMDYSLLTCIDDHTGELVVGVIDYIRTFTLDKKLEMYIKKTAGRVLPTVVYPELYRKRFCEAMDRYFTVVPDKWTGLGADIKL